MKHVGVRLVIAAVLFLMFWILSTIYYGRYIHDVGSTYWSLGVFGLPLALLGTYIADFYYRKSPWWGSRYVALTALDGLVSIILYYPSLLLVLKVIWLTNA